MTKYYDFKTIVYGDDKIMVGDFVDLKFSGQHGKIRKVVYKIGPVKCLPDVVEPEIGMNTDAWLISGEVRDLDTTEWRHTREFKKPRVVMASKNMVEISTNELMDTVKKAVLRYANYCCNPNYISGVLEIYHDDEGDGKRKVFDFDLIKPESKK